MTDLLASFGWNAGKRRPTKTLSPAVWWTLREQAPEDEPSLLAHLHSKYNSPPAKLKLLVSVRLHHGGYLPCRSSPEDTKHRYHVVSKVPFRLRCPACRHNLGGGYMKLVAKLIADGLPHN